MTTILYDTAEAAFAWYLSQAITKGRLTLHARTRTYYFPSQWVANATEPSAELTVHDPAFFLRILAPASPSPDLVFAEAYIRGDVSFASRRDMADFFEVWWESFGFALCLR